MEQTTTWLIEPFESFSSRDTCASCYFIFCIERLVVKTLFKTSTHTVSTKIWQFSYVCSVIDFASASSCEGVQSEPDGKHKKTAWSHSSPSSDRKCNPLPHGAWIDNRKKEICDPMEKRVIRAVPDETEFWKRIPMPVASSDVPMFFLWLPGLWFPSPSVCNQ